MWIVHNLRPYLSVRWVTCATTKKPSSKRNLLESFAPCGEPKPPFYLPSPSIFRAFAKIYKTSFLVSFSNMKKERASFTGPSINCRWGRVQNTKHAYQPHEGISPPCRPLAGRGQQPCLAPSRHHPLAVVHASALFSSGRSEEEAQWEREEHSPWFVLNNTALRRLWKTLFSQMRFRGYRDRMWAEFCHILEPVHVTIFPAA